VLHEARGFGHNDFKIELARRGIVRALDQAARGQPQSQADKRIK
ncbi:MAG: xanthine dehydrogenase family protein subunit M, partial [Xanthobacteraceae bacterium]